MRGQARDLLDTTLAPLGSNVGMNDGQVLAGAIEHAQMVRDDHNAITNKEYRQYRFRKASKLYTLSGAIGANAQFGGNKLPLSAEMTIGRSAATSLDRTWDR